MPCYPQTHPSCMDVVEVRSMDSTPSYYMYPGACIYHSRAIPFWDNGKWWQYECTWPGCSTPNLWPVRPCPEYCTDNGDFRLNNPWISWLPLKDRSSSHSFHIVASSTPFYSNYNTFFYTKWSNIVSWESNITWLRLWVTCTHININLPLSHIGIAFEIIDTGPRVHIMARIAVHRTELNHIHTGWMNSENRRG